MERASGVPLSTCTTLGLGGPATTMVTAATDRELVQVLRSTEGPLLVLGGGSNLVVADAGFPGTVVRIASTGRRIRRHGQDVVLSVAAGEDWDQLVAFTVHSGLAGLECLSGIPGLVGATPIQNVGAYGQDVAQTVSSVRVFDRSTGQVRTVRDCGFGYRRSRFKDEAPRFVVLTVRFRLRRQQASHPLRYPELAGALGVAVGQSAPTREVREAVLALRRRKGMVLDPQDPDSRSAGSFFTNPMLDARQLQALRARGAEPPVFVQADGRAKVPAAWLIEHAGFRPGAFAGPVGISSKHALALVHRGGGTTADLLRVARSVRDGVRDTFGVELVAEPVLVGVRL